MTMFVNSVTQNSRVLAVASCFSLFWRR